MKVEPGKRIGDFRIGEKLIDHPRFVECTKVEDKKFKWGELNIWLTEDGTIRLLSTSNGHFEDVVTGMTFRQVIAAGYELLYDDFDQIFFLNNPRGLVVEKEYENLYFSKLLDAQIRFLTVYDVSESNEAWEHFMRDFILVNKYNLQDIESESRAGESFLKNAISRFKDE